jgi:hypothetical protein
MFIKSRTLKKCFITHKYWTDNNSSQNRASVANTYFFFSQNNSLTLHYLFNWQLSISINAPLPMVTRMTHSFNHSEIQIRQPSLWIWNKSKHNSKTQYKQYKSQEHNTFNTSHKNTIYNSNTYKTKFPREQLSVSHQRTQNVYKMLIPINQMSTSQSNNTIYK